MKLQKILEDLGYKPNECKIYLKLLEYGRGTISEISAKSNIPRTSTQDTVKSMHKRKLLNFYKIGRDKIWLPTQPEELLKHVKLKVENADKALPILNELYSIGTKKTPISKTEKKEVEILKGMAEGCCNAIVILNHNAQIIYINEIFENMTEYKLEDLYGKKGLLLKSKSIELAEYVKALKLLTLGKRFQSDKIAIKKKTGESLNVSLSVVPIKQFGKNFYMGFIEEKHPNSE